MLSARSVLVVQDHGLKPWPGRSLQPLRRRFLAAADGILLNTLEMALPLQQAGILPPSVPCAAVREASSTFQPTTREQARQASGLTGDPLVLWVGRLHSLKDPITAVRGFCLAARHLPDARLVLIYQQAPLVADVRSIVEEHGLTDRVTFKGATAHADLPRYYSAADLFLTSSPWEGSNYALIESMACGVWPVCSNNPSHRGMLGGAVGDLFDVGDATSCADAVTAAATRLAETRAPSKQRVRAHFDATLSWDAVVKQSFEAYEEVIAKRR
jgi:glycosyltransferase involved in cell wall biosynthesis